MTEIPLAIVPFDGATLIGVRGASPKETLIAMRPLVEGMGMDWKTQHRKLTQHPILSEAVVMMTIPWGVNRQEMAALPLSLVPFWMATIQPGRVPDLEVRARIIRYQLECADTLFQHFFGEALESKAPEQPKATQETTAMKLALVRMARQAHGVPAAARLWFELGLPTVPEMFEVHRQRGFRFNLDAAGPEIEDEVH